MNKLKKSRVWMMMLCMLIIGSLLFTLAACGGGNDDAQDDGTQTDNGTTQNDQNDTNDGTDSETNDDDGTSVISQAQLAALFHSGLELTEYAYTIEMTTDFGSTTSKIWIKDDNMRIENEQDGVVYAMIAGKNFSYTLDPTSKTAIGATWDEGEVNGDEDYENINNFVGDVEKEALQYLGQEDINGELCYIIETIDLESDATVTLWIHAEYGITMRAEFLGATPEENVTTELSDLQIGGISDDYFTIPSDYTIVDWDSMLDLPGATEEE